MSGRRVFGVVAELVVVPAQRKRPRGAVVGSFITKATEPLDQGKLSRRLLEWENGTFVDDGRVRKMTA